MVDSHRFCRDGELEPVHKIYFRRACSRRYVAVHIAPPGKSGMQFKPTVLAANRERELRWLGRLLVPGIFDGEHYFLLEPIGSDRTRLTQGEKFSGILVGLFGGTLSATEDGFKAMNVALKRRAEA